jgi:hypothetical protein
MTKKAGILAAAAAFLVLTAVPMQARDHEDKCEHRMHKAELSLQKAISKHGEHSRQADKRRHQLEETREHCGRH